MSKMLCCEYCGTVFDSRKGACPLCGSTFFRDAEPENAPAPEKEVSADDILLESGASQPGKAPAERPVAPRKKPAPRATSPDGDEPVDLSFLDGLFGDDAKPAETAPVQEDSPDVTTPDAPAPRKPSAPSPRTAPAPRPRTAPSPRSAPSPRTASAPQPRTHDQSPNPEERPARPQRRPRPEEKPMYAIDKPDTAEQHSAPETGDAPEKKRRRRKGTITTRDKVVCLVLATLVCIMGLFILYRFLRPYLSDSGATEPSTMQTEPPVDLSCRSILVDKTVKLEEIGQNYILEVTLDPVNTTDALAFSTDAPHVVTVTSEGMLTVVSAGTANITITCGNVMAICTVTCEIEEETEPSETTTPTEETEPSETTEPTIAGPESLELNRDDISFDAKGQTVRLTTGDYDDIVTWTSSDTSVVTVENGLVTAVGGGTAYVYARYGNLEVKCIFRCRFEISNDGDGEDDGVSISHTDVSISVDESFSLRLKDAEGNTLEVTWSVDDSSICSVDGNKVTGLKKGKTVVRCTYNGIEYECIVRVR